MNKMIRRRKRLAPRRAHDSDHLSDDQLKKLAREEGVYYYYATREGLIENLKQLKK